MPQVQTNKTTEAGFVTIEILGALLVVMIILSIVYSLWSKELVEMQKRAVAKHFEMVSIAAQEYAEENRDSFSDGMRRLDNNDFWPASLNRKNAWQQEYVVYSRKNSDNTLQLIILTTGGRTHDDVEPKFGHVIVPSTAAITTIGFIPVGEEATLRGAYNNWEETLPTGDSGIPEALRKAGHLGNVITVADNVSGGGSGGGSGGDGGTTPELDLTGKVDYVQFENVPWEDMKNKCTSDADIGKLYFSNNFYANSSAAESNWNYLQQYNGLFLCMKYQTNGRDLRIIPIGNEADVNRARE